VHGFASGAVALRLAVERLPEAVEKLRQIFLFIAGCGLFFKTT